jgi:hypothetical protein
MKEGKLTNWGLARVAMILGIIYLAANGMDGWGWLIFALIITADQE